MSETESDVSRGLPTPDARHGEPELATVVELAEVLARTPEEQAALDGLAGDPDGQGLELLTQHLRHHAPRPESAEDRAGKTGFR